MYYLLYENTNGENTWELISGEDAMQVRVNELMDTLDLEEDDIMVFNADDQL